ncbi:MAG: hypothetical protein HN790_08720 [Methylococcales bacterium]|nr:hypothetical protein [Methylococcales bacterium]
MVVTEVLESSEHPTLILCRAFEQHKVLDRLVTSNNKRYIVASDDIRVHHLLAPYPNVIGPLWIVQMDTVYSVAESVITVIKEVNDWLRYESGCHPAIRDLIDWPMHCEGGATSQRILDFLLLEKSYESLITTAKLAEVIIINDSVSTWENELIIAIARKHKIPVKILGVTPLKNWLRKNIWRHIKPLAVALFRTSQVLKVKLKCILSTRSPKDDSGLVAIQLVSSSKNHQNHTKVLARALRDEGLDPIIIGWRLGVSASDLTTEGFKLIELEQSVRLPDLILAWCRILISRWRAGFRLGVLSITDNFCANPQVLKNILARSVLDFYFNELLDRAMLKSASSRYFTYHKVQALRPHSLVLPYGSIFFREFRRALPNAQVFIHGGWPYNIHEPITDKEAPIPRNQVMFFACSDLHRRILIDKGFRMENVIVTGLHWVESIMAFSCNTTKRKSRETLGLPEGEWFVLLDASTTLLGYHTAQERQLILNMMLNFAQLNSNCILIIKPHPMSKGTIIKQLVAEYALPNVRLIEAGVLPYDVINASDLLITKTSTMAIEAMYLDVPTIGVVLDNEPNWRVYEEGVEYESSLHGLKIRLQALLDSRLKRKSWCEEMRERQRFYFENHGIRPSDNPSRDVAIAVKNELVIL